MKINLSKKSGRRLLKSLCAFILILSLTGCSVYFSKDGYLDDFTSFVSEIEAKYASYTKEDWAKKEKEYQLYIGEYYTKYKEKLTTDDQKLIGKLKTKYQILKIKDRTQKIIEETSDGLNQLEGAVDGILEDSNNK